jgi:4-hydroxy-2-oxoheptanedioate aldolase
MDLPINHFKQRLLAGDIQYGLWLGLPDTTAAEICAGAGFDWLLIDGEHAPFDLPATMAHLQAMAAYKVSPIVRPVSGDVTLLKQLLDIGAQTLLVPMVETPEQAQQLVQAVRYPPQGIRGLGTSLARAARWNQVPNYLHQANEQICLIVQVETVKALENLEAIVSVEGVDGVFIGPSDLSASMGHIGNAGHPEVVEAINSALSTIQAAGKASGLLCLQPELTESYIEQGARFVGVGVDTLLLAQGAKKLVQQFKQGKVQEDKPQAGY